MMKLRQRWLLGLIILVPSLWLSILFIAMRGGGGGFRLESEEEQINLAKIHRKVSADYSLNSDESKESSEAEREKNRRAGLPKDSTLYFVPQEHPKVPYIKVKDRRKFEALFRDFPSSYELPELTENDFLVRFREPQKRNKIWEKFHQGINRYEMYSYNDSELIETYMNYLGHTKILRAREKSGGTQVKLFLVFIDGGEALMKPWRVPRDYETLPDHYYFADIERHTAEIAFFHLDRILDFRRTPPITGRIFNMTSEFYQRSDKSLGRSFFRSPANNLCFMTNCDQHCSSSETPVCGNPDRIEGSLAAFLPPEKSAKRKSWTHPFKRSYSKREKASWESDPSYCKRVVMKEHPYNSGRRLLDIIDLSILDFLSGNQDRHSYNTFHMFGNFSTIIHLDHGRAFGRYQTDEMSCLVPLIQCCVIRQSTYKRLQILQRNEYKLGDVMRESLSTDLIAPVLYEPHYDALNRRLDIILVEIQKCLAAADLPEDVLKTEPSIEDYHEPEPPMEDHHNEPKIKKNTGEEEQKEIKNNVNDDFDF